MLAVAGGPPKLLGTSLGPPLDGRSAYFPLARVTSQMKRLVKEGRLYPAEPQRWQISFVHPRDDYKNQNRRKNEESLPESQPLDTSLITYFSVKSSKPVLPKNSHKAFVSDLLPRVCCPSWDQTRSACLRDFCSANILLKWVSLIPRDSREPFFWKQLKFLMVGEFENIWINVGFITMIVDMSCDSCRKVPWILDRTKWHLCKVASRALKSESPPHTATDQEHRMHWLLGLLSLD